MNAKSEVEEYIKILKDEMNIFKKCGNNRQVELLSAKINTANKIKSIYEQYGSAYDFCEDISFR